MSERVTLRKGDVFRAKGGPYYIDSSGQKIKMAARGPFRFSCYCEQGDQKWIEAYSAKEGGFTILCLTERESIMPGSYVSRPYFVCGRVTGKPLMRLEGRKDKKKKRSITIDADDIIAAENAAMGMPDKADRRQAKRDASARRAAGARKAAIESVLAGLLPIAPSAQ